MGFDRNLAKAVRSLDEYELRRLVIYAQGLLAGTDGPQFDRSEEASVPKVTLRSQMVRCGRQGCTKCPHGPYWYAYWREGGRSRSKYIGKELPEELVP